MLDKYAELVVKIGLNLQAGQRLMIVNAPLESVPLVHAVTKAAYLAGAKLVTVLWQDQQLRKLQAQYGSRESLEEFPNWTVEAMVDYARRGESQLVISGRDPNLFDGLDPDAVNIMTQSSNKAMRPLNELVTQGAMNWSHISYPTASWARKVFPDLPSDEAVKALWELIYEVCRLKQAEPILAWQAHIERLQSQAAYLNAKSYSSLHYRAPGTNLRIGLVENHRWEAGSALMQNGIRCVPNIPTEEVFTMPHRDKVDGYVCSTKPLVYQGKIIEDFSLYFEAGRVIKAEAKKGLLELQTLLDSDEGASRLGEVALVSHSSPIAQSRTIFYNMLYDENAASHLALGRAFRINIKGGTEMSASDFFAAGGNDSLIHADFMIGSAELDVDGICSDGRHEPILRKGEWLIH